MEHLPTRAIRGELPPVQRRPVRGTLPTRGTSADAWNIAVRTRGVFTHRDDFQKPACVERGLVRTGKTHGWPGLVRTGKTLGRPPLARTGITPVISESTVPSPYAILKPPSRLCYFEAIRPPRLCAILRVRPVYALFLEPHPRPAYAILKIKNICMKTVELCKYFFYICVLYAINENNTKLNSKFCSTN